jgi:hypothetical protein
VPVVLKFLKIDQTLTPSAERMIERRDIGKIHTSLVAIAPQVLDSTTYSA